MQLTSRAHRSQNGRQYWKIIPNPTSQEEADLVQNWKDTFDNNNEIIDTFFDVTVPQLNGIMGGNRGEVWEYLSLDEEEIDWPHEFVVYEI